MVARLYNFGWLIENEIAGSRGPQSIEQIKYFKDQGIRAMVRMTEMPWVKPAEIENMGISDYHEPVPDMEAPSVEQIEDMLNFIAKCLAEGKPVAFSCDGGIGRTGTLMACYLVNKENLTADEAINQVKQRRPGTIFTENQLEGVREYARRHKE